MDAIATQRSVFALALPEALLVLVACLTFVGGAFKPSRVLWGCVALAGVALAGLAMAYAPGPGVDVLNVQASALWPDRLAFLVRIVSLTGGAILILLIWRELPEAQAADSFACLLVIIAGTSLTGIANELITLFLSLELVSIPTYVLLYLPRSGRNVQEAAIKYFLLSIFSSALLLFGFSYLYGLTGTTQLAGIHQRLFEQWGNDSANTLATLALVLALAGFSFRLAAVPFHFYAPDVYEGAPVGAAAALAFVPKVAGVAGLIRVLGLVPIMANESRLNFDELSTLLWILAAITMTVGNVLAVLQDNVKRMLAYSSVAHAGYILIGLAADPHTRPGGAIEAVLFYLVAYGAMTLGAFAVLNYIGTEGRTVDTVDDLAGLGQTHAGPAILMALFLFSLIGLPATAGFAGKLLVFSSALATNEPLYRGLAVIGAVNAAIGGYYYLRLVGTMYLRPALNPLPPARGVPGLVAVWLCAGLVLWLGVYPWPTLRLAREAAHPTFAVPVAGR